MSQSRIEQIENLLEAASALTGAGRVAFFASACPHDDELRREVESLLAYEEQAGDFLTLNVWQELAKDMNAAPPTLQAGQEIGQYHILSFLERGGMGEVYLVRDTRLGRLVALKLLTEEFASDPNRVHRFEQEARAVSALNHPNIITIYEIAQHDGALYIAYELVEGDTLRLRLSRGELSWQETVAIGAQVAAALNAAHSAGIIHRDIKPENVMLRADGLVKVLDFGIAKRFDLPTDEAGSGAMAAQANATQAGLVLGTAGYLSPEQARGEKEIDAGTDIFSLGLMMYEMLAEHPYHELPVQEKIKAVSSSEELPPLSTRRKDLPSTLNALVTRAVRKSRGERFSTAGEMLDALNELQPPTQTKLEDHARRLAQKRANQLLNQAVTLYASDKSVRLSPAALWKVWRHSTVKHGLLESSLLRRSYLSALGKVTAIAMLAGLVTFVFAVWYSIEEKWEEKILRDGHATQVRQLALAHDGRTLVSVGDDAKVIVWDFARRERRATLTEHNQRVSAVTFAPNDKWFATASYDGRLIVWDAAQLRPVETLPSPQRGVSTIAFTPDGQRLITPLSNSSDAFGLALWETGQWKKVGELEGVSTFVISPDNRFLISQSWRTFDLQTGKMFSDNAQTGPHWGQGALSPDGMWLASVDSSGFLSIWDLRTFWRSAQRRPPQRYPAHRDRGRAVAYSPDGRMIATGGENIIVWDARTHAKLARFEHKDRVTSLAFSKDARQLISAHGDGAILVWDLAEKEALANFAEHCAPVRAARFSPDGKYVASASDDGSIIVWDATRGTKQAVLTGHRRRISSIAFAPNGQRLASIDLDGTVILWDVGQRTPVFTIPPAKKREDLFGYTVAISPDGSWLVTSFGVYALTGNHDLKMMVEFMPTTERKYDEIYGADFSSDGRWLACVTPHRGVLLWDVATWQLRQPAHKPGNLTSVSFAPDSRYLVTGEDQGAVRVWQVEPLQEVAVLGRHNGYVRSVTFAHDGQRVASVGDDGAIKLWDIRSRKLLKEIGTHTAPVLAVAFSPDDQQIVSGEQDKSVRVYTRRRTLWSWQLD